MALKQPVVQEVPKGVLKNEFLRDCRHTLSKWVRRQREAMDPKPSGLELAETIGFSSRQEIGRIESGGNLPQEHSVVPYAEALNVPPKEFARRLLACSQPWAYAVLFGKAETEALIGRDLMDYRIILDAPASVKKTVLQR